MGVTARSTAQSAAILRVRRDFVNLRHLETRSAAIFPLFAIEQTKKWTIVSIIFWRPLAPNLFCAIPSIGKIRLFIADGGVAILALLRFWSLLALATTGTASPRIPEGRCAFRDEGLQSSTSTG